MEDKMEDIQKLDERIKLEKENIPVPEHTIEAAIAKAHRMASNIRASKIVRLKGSNLDKVLKCAQGIDDAMSDAKCKVDCITVSADSEKCASAFDKFIEDAEKELEEIKKNKLTASRKLTRLAGQIMKTRNLDMNKVVAHVHGILAGVNVKSDISRQEITQNLTNLVNKSRTDQKLMTLVDWGKAGIAPTAQVKTLTVDDLQKIITSMKGAKD